MGLTVTCLYGYWWFVARPLLVELLKACIVKKHTKKNTCDPLTSLSICLLSSSEISLLILPVQAECVCVCLHRPLICMSSIGSYINHTVIQATGHTETLPNQCWVNNSQPHFFSFLELVVMVVFGGGAQWRGFSSLFLLAASAHRVESEQKVSGFLTAALHRWRSVISVKPSDFTTRPFHLQTAGFDLRS